LIDTLNKVDRVVGYGFERWVGVRICWGFTGVGEMGDIFMDWEVIFIYYFEEKKVFLFAKYGDTTHK
jgi:hypothetical protein